jgi:tRNA (guanine37-N1)-methyltransferase
MSDNSQSAAEILAPQGPRLEVEIITLFPEFFTSFLHTSLLGKAIAGGLVAVGCTNPRDFAPGRHRQVDDSPYGGGPGMVLRPEPMAVAIEEAEQRGGRAHRILLSPAGHLFNQSCAARWAESGRLMLICGRYEGVDERIAQLFADEVVSIGDYVLSGGEAAALVVIEATTRLIPGVLGSEESIVEESFSSSSGRLECPHWTRPSVFRGLSVPELLVSGNHALVARWRRREALRRTLTWRPDLIERYALTEEERSMLAEIDMTDPTKGGRG